MHLYQIMSVAVFNRSNCLTYFHEFCPSSCVLSVSCLKLMAPAGALGRNMWVKQAHMWYHPVVFGKTILWEACCTKTWPSISHSSGPHNYDDPLCTAVVLENASIHSLWLPSDVPSLPCGVKGQCKGGQHNGQWEHLSSAKGPVWSISYTVSWPIATDLICHRVISGSPLNAHCFWIIVKERLQVDGWTSILNWRGTIKVDRCNGPIYQELIHSPILLSTNKKARFHCARYERTTAWVQ